MMPKIHLHVLASGSGGNAAVVEGPGGNVLIDDGLSRRELLRRADAAGCDIDDVVAVILTHEHGDHVSGVSVLHNRHDAELLATAGTASGRKFLCELPFTIFSSTDSFDVAGMNVQVFPTSHDVAEPVGLRFSVLDAAGQTEDALGWCTDTGYLTAEALGALRGVRILGIESNHDLDMLAHGPYPSYLKARVGGERGHLSNAQCAEALPLLVGPDTETVVALHLSEKNNRPAVCVRTLAAALDAVATDDTWTEARTADGLVTICVASQDEPLSVL